MARKISFLILSVAILVTGIKGFSKLNYWDRSVRIFSLTADASFEGRAGRDQDGRGFESREGGGGREGFARPEIRDRPDTIKEGFEAGETRRDPGMRERNIPDSLRQQSGPGNGDRRGRGTSEVGGRPGDGRGRGEFPGGNKINLRNVKWFLAVFTSLTVLIIYIDKAFELIRRRKRREI
jgi:hypothetical protein